MKNFVTLLGTQVEKQNADKLLRENGFSFERVDVNAFIGCISDRWVEQEVVIPEKKTGNLKKYAGKTVVVIPTTIDRNGPRINFYIKAL